MSGLSARSRPAIAGRSSSDLRRNGSYSPGPASPSKKKSPRGFFPHRAIGKNAAAVAAGVATVCLGAAIITSGHRKRYRGEVDSSLPPELSYIHRHWHPMSRSERFPPVDERVRIYMSNWYVPPCTYYTSPQRTSAAAAESPESAPHFLKSRKDRIWYRYEYPNLNTWSSRPNFNASLAINYVAEVFLDSPLHYPSADSCHDVALTTDVETATPKDYEKHNLYVLDRDITAKCADMTPRVNHHSNYCRDSMEMLDLMDELDRLQIIDEDGAARSGDVTTRARDGLRLNQVAYGYDPKVKEFRFNADAMRDKKTGQIKDIVNTRSPVIVRFGDTLGVYCSLPIIGKTRISAEGRTAVESNIDTTALDRFPSLVPPPGKRLISAPLSDACYPLNLHIPRPPLQTVDEAFEQFSPIIWDFHNSRSNEMLEEVLRNDIPWEDKKPIAYWRGALTGAREDFDRSKMSDKDVCYQIPRCRLVALHDKSKLVDARLTYNKDVPMENFKKIQLFTENNRKETYADQLHAKALIVMEGNDLATGLRWSLLSRSVVMMPPPQRTSWAMEEWLEPWVHYIPINGNLTNVEDQVRWMKANDKEAHRIAERGALFAYDLVLHSNAKDDDNAVKREMLRRYRQHFAPDNRYYVQ